MRARYLTFFSYIGTNFRSSEKVWLKEGSHHPDPLSVQGLMELALLKLRSLIYPKITLSSRTDKGVHALQSSAHLDLEKFGTGTYDPQDITNCLNRTFQKNLTSIHVHKCLRVNDSFDARANAKSRTYMYRFAVLKKDAVLPEKCSIHSLVPIEEWKRCYYVRLPEFDINKFIEGTRYFVGYHDFTSFKKFNKTVHPSKHNRRLLYSIDVREGKPIVTSYARKEENAFDYYEVQVHGRAFVHNQIRRMIGTLFSLAIGKLNPEDIQVMLQVPSKSSWHSCINTVPADGLYLCNVEYDPEELVFHGAGEVERLSESDLEEKD